MSFFIIIKGILSHLVSKIILSIVTTIIFRLIKYQYKFLYMLNKIRNRADNTEIQFKLHITYNTNVDFEIYNKNTARFFKDYYKNLKSLKETAYFREMLIGNLFEVSSQKIDDTIIFQTCLINCTIKSIIENVQGLLNVLEKIEDEIVNISQDMKFEANNFSLSIYLPSGNIYSEVFTPDYIKVNNYDIVANYNEYENVINLTTKYVNINTNKRHKLEKIIKQFV